MCLGYITARTCSSAVKVSVNPYVILLLGALPDIDIVFESLGLGHRTVTHSALFWSIVFIPVFVEYGKRGLPYFVATIQHIVVGDLIVGRVNPVWPFFDNELGLGVHLTSFENIVLEGVSLVLFFILVWKNMDYRMFLGVARRRLWSLVTLIPLLAFLLFLSLGSSLPLLAVDNLTNSLGSIVRWVFRSDFMPAVIVMHLLLAVFLLASVVKGSKPALTRMRTRE